MLIFSQVNIKKIWPMIYILRTNFGSSRIKISKTRKGSFAMLWQFLGRFFSLTTMDVNINGFLA